MIPPSRIRGIPVIKAARYGIKIVCVKVVTRKDLKVNCYSLTQSNGTVDREGILWWCFFYLCWLFPVWVSECVYVCVYVDVCCTVCVK